MFRFSLWRTLKQSQFICWWSSGTEWQQTWSLVLFHLTPNSRLAWLGMCFSDKEPSYQTSSLSFSSTFHGCFKDSFPSPLFWKMKHSKQPGPALSLSLDLCCISATVTIWNFSSASLPFPADLPQVPLCHIEIHSGHYCHSRNLLPFFHPL